MPTDGIRWSDNYGYLLCWPTCSTAINLKNNAVVNEIKVGKVGTRCLCILLVFKKKNQYLQLGERVIIAAMHTLTNGSFSSWRDFRQSLQITLHSELQIHSFQAVSSEGLAHIHMDTDGSIAADAMVWHGTLMILVGSWACWCQSVGTRGQVYWVLISSIPTWEKWLILIQ